MGCCILPSEASILFCFLVFNCKYLIYGSFLSFLNAKYLRHTLLVGLQRFKT